MSYDSTASYYDAIYTAMKDYGLEAGRVCELIAAHQLAQATCLLDVACGTGLHLEHLRHHFDVMGIDLSQAQLDIAVSRLPGIPLHHADMINFDLGRKFGAVTCLFSAIGHLLTEVELHAAIARMAAHLEPGGLLVVEPWLSPEAWRDGHLSVETAELDGHRKIVRISRSWRDERITHLEMHHFVTNPPDPAEYILEHHQTALYARDEYLGAFQAAGLTAWFDQTGLSDNGRGVYLGLKPPH